MGLLLLAAFIGVPLIEIAVFIQVGGVIGLGWTLLVVVATAVAGTWLLRAQGLATLHRARRQLDAGVLPARELFDGLCLLFAGALLLTPGFVTDAMGLLLFIPPFRELLRRAVVAYLQHAARAGKAETRIWVNGEPVGPGGTGPGGAPRRAGGAGPGVIEGDYQDVTEEEAPHLDRRTRR
jgi:UPF0716 protein FxsA